MNVPAIAFGACIAALALLQPATTGFELLDNFETYRPGNVVDDPGSPWSAHVDTSQLSIVEESGNRFLAYGWSEGPRGGSRPLPANLAIGPGDQATLVMHFRAGRLTPGSNQSAHFGLTHDANTGSHDPADDFRIRNPLAARLLAR